MSRRVIALIFLGIAVVPVSYFAWVEAISRWQRATLRKQSQAHVAAVRYFGRQIQFEAEASYRRHTLLAEYLEKFAEQPLQTRDRVLTPASYRFTWLRSFHRPVVFRVDFPSENTATLTIKFPRRWSAYGGSWDAVSIETRKLDKSIAEQLRAHAFRLRAIPMVEPETSVRDGANWFFELAEGDRYHLICQNPPENAPREMGELLIRQTGIDDVVLPIY